MATRSTKHNPTIATLTLWLGAMGGLNTGCARDQSLRPPDAVAQVSFVSTVWDGVEAAPSPSEGRSKGPVLLTLCANSDLDLPCRLHSSEASSLAGWPADSTIELPRSRPVRTPSLGNACPSVWSCDPACGSTCGFAGESACDPVFAPGTNGCDIAVAEPPGMPRILWDGSRFEHLWDRCADLPADIGADYRNFYSCRGLRDLLLGVGAAAVLANTSLDQGFRDWYQKRVQNDDTDQFGNFWNYFGDGAYVIPSVVALAAAGALFDDTPSGSVLAEFGSRATRAYLVGAPPVVFGQWALGGARPGESERESRWSPFQDTHAISGHAFIGAVPFITAAKMSDCLWLKGGLYGLSVLPGWARVNRDKHYLSQAILGWWIAWLSCTAVDQTEFCARRCQVFPLVSADTAGIGLVCPW